VLVVALCFVNDGNNAEMLWSYAMSIVSEQSNTTTLCAARLLRFCIKSFHLRNNIECHFTYLRLLHQLGHYDEFHAQVMKYILQQPMIMCKNMLYHQIYINMEVCRKLKLKKIFIFCKLIHSKTAVV